MKAQSNPRYSSIMEATHSIIFFGTPHQGSEHASLGVILQNIHTVLSRQQKSPLPKTLKTNNPKLRDLGDDFRHQASNYKIVSCFEQLITSPLDSLVGFQLLKKSINEGLDPHLLFIALTMLYYGRDIISLLVLCYASCHFADCISIGC